MKYYFHFKEIEMVASLLSNAYYCHHTKVEYEEINDLTNLILVLTFLR